MQNPPDQDRSVREENRPVNASAERLPKVEGFDRKKDRSGSNARRDPSAVLPLGAESDPGAAKPAGEQRKRHRRFTQPLTEPERALVKDARRVGPAPQAGTSGALHSCTGVIIPERGEGSSPQAPSFSSGLLGAESLT
jgi:hypothetical protein